MLLFRDTKEDARLCQTFEMIGAENFVCPEPNMETAHMCFVPGFLHPKL